MQCTQISICEEVEDHADNKLLTNRKVTYLKIKHSILEYQLHANNKEAMNKHQLTLNNL